MDHDLHACSQLIAFNIAGSNRFDLRNCFTNWNNLVFLREDEDDETDSRWIRIGIQVKTVDFINGYHLFNEHLQKNFGDELLQWLPRLSWCSNETG